MPARTICLFFSDTGGGHRSATEAVKAAIYSVCAQSWGEANPEQQVNVFCENVAERSHWLNRAFVETYNFLLRHNQAGMKYYYWFIHQFKLNNSMLGHWLLGPYTKKLLSRTSPDVIVSLHPMINQYLLSGMRDSGAADRPPFVVVVTDPNNKLWRGWACPEADLTIVPNEAVKGQLIAWGVPQEKIRVIGMPVNPAFLKPPACDRATFLRQLELDPEIFTLCLNAGWAGGGNLIAVYQALNKMPKKIQVIFLCGYYNQLFSKMFRWTPFSKIPTRVFSFHDNMPDLMNAVDLMVTKAGGLTTFEGLASRLPMAIDVITEPMPQEVGTIDILLQANLVQVIKKPDDIIGIIENTPRRAENKNFVLPPFQNLNRVDAVYEIAEAVLSQLDLFDCLKK